MFVTLEMLRAAKTAEIKAFERKQYYYFSVQKCDSELDRLEKVAYDAADNFLTIRQRFQECFGVRKKTAPKLALDNQSSSR